MPSRKADGIIHHYLAKDYSDASPSFVAALDRCPIGEIGSLVETSSYTSLASHDQKVGGASNKLLVAPGPHTVGQVASKVRSNLERCCALDSVDSVSDVEFHLFSTLQMTQGGLSQNQLHFLRCLQGSGELEKILLNWFYGDELKRFVDHVLRLSEI